MRHRIGAIAIGRHHGITRRAMHGARPIFNLQVTRSNTRHDARTSHLAPHQTAP